MSTSEFIFDRDEPVAVGDQGQNDTAYGAGEPIPDTGDSDFVFEDGIGLGRTRKVWHSDQPNNVFAELAYSDFSVVQSRSSPDGVEPDGMGGSGSQSFGSQSGNDTGTQINKFYEFDANLNLLRSYDPFYETGVREPSECGGKSDTFWVSDYDSDDTDNIDGEWSERNTSDFSVIRAVSAAGKRSNGAGGDTNIVYLGGDGDYNTLTKRSYSDLSVLSSLSVDSNGMGGTKDVIYNNEKSGSAVIQERDPADFSVVKENPTPTGSVSGNGGQ